MMRTKRRQTKLQRLNAASRKSKQKRMSNALAKYLQSIGIRKVEGAKVHKNPSGSITIIPVKIRRAR